MANETTPVQNETGFIVLKTAHGVDVPVRYGLSGIRRLCKYFGCSLAQLGDKIKEAMEADQLDTMELLVKIGAETEAALNGTTLNLTPDQLLSALDTPGSIDALMGAFNESFGSMQTAADNAESAGKTKPSQK